MALRCQVQAMAETEIISHIPEHTLRRIRERDRHPTFQAYSLVHEGTSTPKILCGRAKPTVWVRAAVQSIKSAVLKGLRFFLGHGRTNDTSGREPVGEVVGNFEKEIDGQLHHVVIGYFPDPRKVEKCDACSHEGEWNLTEYQDHYEAGTLDRMTGIALYNSQEQEPAFPGARRLAMVQAYDNSGEQKKETKMEINLATASIDEIRAEVKRRNVLPRQLFAVEELKEDKDIEKIVKDLESAAKALKEKDDRITAMSEDRKKLDAQIVASTAKDRLVNLLKDEKVTERQEKYILRSFKPEGDVTDAGLKKYVADKLTDYKANAEFFGGAGQEQVEQSSGTQDTTDLTKKDNNPLLAEDLE